MKKEYVVIQNTYYYSTFTHTSYGIALAELCDDTPVVLQSVPDISKNREKVQMITDCFNKHGLDPIHFMEAIYVFIELYITP